MKQLFLIVLLLTCSLTGQAQTETNKKILISTDSTVKINFDKDLQKLEVRVKVERELKSLSMEVEVEVEEGRLEMFVTDARGRKLKRFDLEGSNQLKIWPAFGSLTDTRTFPVSGEWLINFPMENARGTIMVKVELNED